MENPDTLTELTQQAVRKEAVIWLARIDRGLRIDEVATLRGWLGLVAHRECILTTARLWHGPETVSVLAALFPVSAEPAKCTRGRPWPVLLATTIIATVVVTVATLTISSTFDGAVSSRSTDRIHATDAGQTRQISLTDGSVVQLNSDSKIRLTYGDVKREIQLLRGEARFSVAPDAARPFDVYASAQSFQSMGGVFDVRIAGPDHVALIVTEGDVRVMRPLIAGTAQADRKSNRRPPAYIKVMPFEAVQLKSGLHTMRKISPAQADAILAWHSMQAQ